jgi:hypothetical protein
MSWVVFDNDPGTGRGGNLYAEAAVAGGPGDCSGGSIGAGDQDRELPRNCASRSFDPGIAIAQLAQGDPGEVGHFHGWRKQVVLMRDTETFLYLAR